MLSTPWPLFQYGSPWSTTSSVWLPAFFPQDLFASRQQWQHCTETDPICWQSNRASLFSPHRCSSLRRCRPLTLHSTRKGWWTTFLVWWWWQHPLCPRLPCLFPPTSEHRVHHDFIMTVCTPVYACRMAASTCFPGTRCHAHDGIQLHQVALPAPVKPTGPRAQPVTGKALFLCGGSTDYFEVADRCYGRACVSISLSRAQKPATRQDTKMQRYFPSVSKDSFQDREQLLIWQCKWPTSTYWAIWCTGAYFVPSVVPTHFKDASCASVTMH